MSHYLVLEGLDGSGKSLQARQLVKWLSAQGRGPVHLREPGSTPVGEALRRVLLTPKTGRLSPLTEALLFSAARSQLLMDEIRPALDSGRVVVAERCFLSTLVYQGMAPEEDERVPMEMLRTLTAHIHRDRWPDAIFLLDIDAETSALRSGADRIERRGSEYRRRVREGFLLLAENDPRIHVVDSTQPPEVVQDTLREKISELGA